LQSVPTQRRKQVGRTRLEVPLSPRAKRGRSSPEAFGSISSLPPLPFSILASIA
jgi:hypothetical protein